MATEAGILLLRADASERLGTGHVMRCLALAHAWQEAGGRTVFVGACLPEALERRLAADGVQPMRLSAEPGSDADADATRETLQCLGGSWVVLDGYHFSGKFQRRIRRDGVRVLAIDDYGNCEHYAADLVLNQNLHATEEPYREREPYTGLLLGTKFALLRREFRKWRGWKRDVPESGRKVLVTLGGSDPDKVTLKVVEALERLDLPDLETVVVIGGGNPYLLELEAAAHRVKSFIRLRTNVTDMPELMAWADVAVAAGGTSTWERALMGLPSLVLVLAGNQIELAEASAQTGIGWNLGWHAALGVPALRHALERMLTDPAARAEMAQRGPQWVDGQGASRVVARMRACDLRLRPARAEDCRLIWEWANEPPTRRASFSSIPIPWEQHQQWFDNKLKDPGCVFLIALDVEGAPIGQMRFDVDSEEAEISVSLAERFHGLGYGPTVIRHGAQALFAARPVRRISAYVRTENVASYRAFEKVGFKLEETTMVQGTLAHRLVLRKEQTCSPI